MCYRSDESNNILQIKLSFGKINPRNKPGVSMHSRFYDYKSTNYYYNNCNIMAEGFHFIYLAFRFS